MGRVLLTGGAGFIGSNLARSRLGDGIEVGMVDDLSLGRADNVPAGAELIQRDLGSPGTAERLPGRDYVGGAAHRCRSRGTPS